MDQFWLESFTCMWSVLKISTTITDLTSLPPFWREMCSGQPREPSHRRILSGFDWFGWDPDPSFELNPDPSSEVELNPDPSWEVGLRQGRKANCSKIRSSPGFCSGYNNTFADGAQSPFPSRLLSAWGVNIWKAQGAKAASVQFLGGFLGSGSLLFFVTFIFGSVPLSFPCLLMFKLLFKGLGFSSALLPITFRLLNLQSPHQQTSSHWGSTFEIHAARIWTLPKWGGGSKRLPG